MASESNLVGKNTSLNKIERIKWLSELSTLNLRDSEDFTD